MSYQIIASREICEGNAESVSLAPTVFDLDDEEIWVLASPEGARETRIFDAATACPTDA